MKLLFIFPLVLYLGSGARGHDDDEHNYYRYLEEYDVTSPYSHPISAIPAPHTLSDEEISIVEDALKRLLHTRNVDEIMPTLTQAMRDTTTSWYTVKNIFSEILKKVEDEKQDNDHDVRCSVSPFSTLTGFKVNRESCDADSCIVEASDYSRENSNKDVSNSTDSDQENNTTNKIEHLNLTTNYPETENAYEFDRSFKDTVEMLANMAIERARRDYGDEETTQENSLLAPDYPELSEYSFNNPTVVMGRQGQKTTRSKDKSRRRKTTTKSRRRRTNTKLTASTQTQPHKLDMAKLMDIISNLTEDYSQNLTEKIRSELESAGFPSCNTSSDTPSSQDPGVSTTEDPYANLTGTIMGKCFVCGLEEPDMPRDAACADAFAGDIVPLVPVQMTAKRHLAAFRKYCRWMNVPKYFINETDSRSMWGRWTGGCSVRWIDISGIYTQRTCRNRHRAVMGKHWGSKRMAKLEMALQREDNACIISPMATLVPLSRGISLYARFHACVCTGSWCNGATSSRQCMSYATVVLAVVVVVVRTVVIELRVRVEAKRKCMLYTMF